jgi:hypothetical protein
MPATKTTPTTALHTVLLEAFDVKSRADGSVHSIRDKSGRTVAEVCVGKKNTRINLKQVPPAKARKSLVLEGKSKSWPGGGLVVTSANVAAVRKLLVAVTSAGKASAPVKPTATAPAAPASPSEAGTRAATSAA